MKERFTRLAPDADISVVDPATKLYSGIGSDESQGRDDNIVRTAGIQSAAWLEYGGPMPYCHDDAELPVARAVRAAISGTDWRIWFRFATHPFACMVQDLVDAGFISSLSLSWKPIPGEYRQIRGGGIEFLSVDVIECSIVQCPALPSALIDARSRGIDTLPMRTWAENAILRRSAIMPRPELEAIARACAPARTFATSTRGERQRRARELASKGREDRRRVARELVARGRRQNTVARIQGGKIVKTESSNGIRKVRRHLARALKHHRALTEHHGEIAGGVKKLRSIHRAITSTLAELGYRSRSSKSNPAGDLEECIRALATAHGDADDSAALAAGLIDDADEVLVDTFAATAAANKEDDD